MKALGIAFVVLGILAVVYGGMRYSRQRTVRGIGVATTTQKGANDVPLTPIAGGIGVISGIALLAVPRKRTTPGWIEHGVPDRNLE